MSKIDLIKPTVSTNTSLKGDKKTDKSFCFCALTKVCVAAAMVLQLDFVTSFLSLMPLFD
jgi:hypothetical protein